MARFKFELDSLLKYRKHQRDQCRQLLGSILEQETASLNEIQSTQQEREQVSEEIRVESAQGAVDVQFNASRRFYQSQLDLNIRQVQMQLEQVREQIVLCRKALQQADAAVKALEQLREKRLQKHEYHEAKRLEVEMQDAWSAIQQIGNIR
ncbi:MAG: flagellar FliJ family protein [Planctomycetaceae bacterium]|nr:flagellar FliJ family protein [Planctomycetaceae bacterium]